MNAKKKRKAVIKENKNKHKGAAFVREDLVRSRSLRSVEGKRRKKKPEHVCAGIET